MARPTSLNPAVQAAIVASLEGGSSIKAAAEAAGVSEAVLHNWNARGRAAADWRPEAIPEGTHELAGPGPKCSECGKTMRARVHNEYPANPDARYVEFLEATTRARARSVEIAVSALYRAGVDVDGKPVDWRAIVAWLEKRERDEFGRHVKVEQDFLSEAARKLAAEYGLDEAEILELADGIAREAWESGARPSA